MQRVLFILFISFVSITSVLANNGWELLKKDDLKGAKQAFEAELKTNPTNQDALKGLIFIAETAQDRHSYNKYIKKLIEIDWNESTYGLFDHVYEGDAKVILQQNLSESGKLKAMLYVADSLFENRKKEKAIKMWRSVLGDYNWSVIGPFKNVAGSGHIAKHEVETDAFSPDKVYLNDNLLELQWLDYSYRDPNGLLEVDELLPKSSEEVYFANTFIKVASDRTLQFRLSRTEPVKIWLDNDLIYDNNDPSIFDWDQEIVSVNVKAGTHRILIKLSPFPDIFSDKRGSFSLYFQDGSSPFMEDSYYETSLFSYGGSNSYSLSFALRLTDEKGKHYTDITSNIDGNYKAKDYNPTTIEQPTIAYFQKLVKDNPNNWGNYYLLAKAYIKQKKYLVGEEFFVELLKENETFNNSIYFKFLLAKFYSNTDKSDRAEALLSGVDEEKTPLFELMYQEFQKIDAEKEEDKYFAALEKLHEVSPSNWGVISKFISFYDDKGKRDEKRAFIQSVINRFPKFKETLDPYLEDDSYKPSSYKPMTDKEREQSAKKAKKNIKSRFRTYDYETLIRYNKNNEKVTKVIDLYEDLIKMLPYRTDYKEALANYLFENDQLDAALKVLYKINAVEPFNTDAMETIGDIFVEKKEEKKALTFYEKANKIKKGLAAGRGYYGADLEKKINRIKGEERNVTKELFKVVTFDEVLADTKWKEKYTEEESVILMYTIDVHLKEDNNFDVESKMMIKILNEAGARFWTEANFNFLGRVNSAKVIKPDGREITPEMSYSYAVIKNLEPGDVIQVKGNYEYNMSVEVSNESFWLSGLSYEAPIYYQKLELISAKDQYLNIACNRMECENYEKRIARNYQIFLWERNDVPKIEQEDAVLDRLDAVSWIMIGTMKDWSRISQWYLDKTYRKLELNYEIRNAVDTVIKDGMSKEEKVIALYNFITTDITYSYVSFLQSNFIPKSPSSTLAAGIGDCKDVASLMISMLRHVGIESYYVLVKTRDFTDLEPVPSILFDHVIVGYILDDGKMRYMDLTTDYYPYYVIHEGDSDAWGLLVDEGSNQAMRLPDDFLNEDKNILKIKSNVTLNTDKSVSIEASSYGNGLIGGRIREEVNGLPISEQKKYISTFFGENVFKNLEVTEFDLGDLKGITPPLESTYSLRANSFMDKVSNLFIFQLPFLQAIGSSPILTPATRYNALDLAQLFEITPTIQDIKVDIPQGYEMIEIPENATMDNKYFKYILSFKKDGNGMTIHREMYFKSRVIHADDYVDFKEKYLALLDVDLMKHYIMKKK